MKLSEEIDNHLSNELLNRTVMDFGNWSPDDEREEEDEEEEEEEEGDKEAFNQENRIELRSSSSSGYLPQRERIGLYPSNHTGLFDHVVSNSTSGTSNSSSLSLSSSPTSSSAPLVDIQTTTSTPTSNSLLLSSLSSSSEQALETTTPTVRFTSSVITLTTSQRLQMPPEPTDLSRSANAIVLPSNRTANSPSDSQVPLQSSHSLEPPEVRTTTLSPTARSPRPTTKPRFSKRKIQGRDFGSQTPPPNAHIPQSLTRPLAPNDVCRDDPCGPGIPCHPTKNGFDCICPDERRIKPGGNCTTESLNFVPSPQPIPSKAYKPNDQPALIIKNNQPRYTDSGWFSQFKSRNLLGVFLAASVLLMVILVVSYWRRKAIFALLRHRHRDKKSGSQSPASLAKSSSLLTYNFASNPNYYAQAPDNLPLQTLAVQFIDKEQVAFFGELGEGCFGKVYKGEYGPRCPENLLANENSGSSPRVSVTVAVKVLKDCAGVEAEADFMREVEIMSAFRHENILSLIGIVATETGGTPWMVFEYMPYGDLAEVLRSCNKQFYANDPPVKSLGKEDLLNMSVQIASGMEYLSSQHFVHRDLACRNCLVGENLCVKISDFGMSRDVYTCDYYKVGGTRMLPVRWMAPESIMYGKFTLESDVWSFGVVLWEIYSFGKQPYYGNSNEHVVKLILQGILLSPPDTCPAQVCDVMRRCWSTEPHDRLKFPEILTSLTRILHGNPESTPPLTPSTPGPSITYSELCMHDDGDLQLDADQYLMPKKAEYREYLTVLSEV